jgi:hypothetical protein
MMNSAMPRLRVFVAANRVSLGDLSLRVTQRTFICALLELLVGGSLLHEIENLNTIQLEKVVFSRWRPSPDCSGLQAQVAMLFLGWWDQTSRAGVGPRDRCEL